MKKFFQKILIGLIFGASTAISFVLFSSIYGAPITSGQTGVPVNGYLYEILQNKVLTNGNFNTTDGKVVNSERLDGIVAPEYQRVITGNCPVGEWAVGVTATGALKCRAN